jgi:3-oxoacyl-[acyl-carrier protein] reductase
VTGLSSELAEAFSLSGRTAVVTGAAMGIGRETAIVYGKAGATVVLADIDAGALGAVAAEIPGSIIVPTDVTKQAAVDELAQAAVEATGRLDVWANVAGILRRAALVDTTEDVLDSVLAVNLKGVFWGTAAAGRIMGEAGRGSIVNVASSGGEMATPNIATYGMSKAGVIHLTRTAAVEYGPLGVRVNSVAPGYVESPMTTRSWTTPEGVADPEARSRIIGGMAAMSPLGRIGTARDMALAMLYLASDASAFFTGQVLRPNGGVPMA